MLVELKKGERLADLAILLYDILVLYFASDQEVGVQRVIAHPDKGVVGEDPQKSARADKKVSAIFFDPLLVYSARYYFSRELQV